MSPRGNDRSRELAISDEQLAAYSHLYESDFCPSFHEGLSELFGLPATLVPASLLSCIALAQWQTSGELVDGDAVRLGFRQFVACDERLRIETSPSRLVLIGANGIAARGRRQSAAS